MAQDKKIIIDEDWKSQVQAEKEQAGKRKTETPTHGEELDPFGGADMPMPLASLELLLTTLATEALVALGQVPHPATRQMHVQRNHAKYLIDTIDVLRQKTTGNLTPVEQELIDNLLHQLRIVFVESGSEPAQNRDASTSPADQEAINVSLEK